MTVTTANPQENEKPLCAGTVIKGERKMARTTRTKRIMGALALLKQVREGMIAPKELSTQERRVCVAYLRLEGYTQEEIAEIFGVHRQTIARDERANRKDAARLVDELDLRSVAGGLIAWAKHLTAKALKAGDHALAWKIQRELLSDLQSLGYLPRSTEQHYVEVRTVADLVRLTLGRDEQKTIEAREQEKLMPPSPFQLPETTERKETEEIQ